MEQVNDTNPLIPKEAEIKEEIYKCIPCMPIELCGMIAEFATLTDAEHEAHVQKILFPPNVRYRVARKSPPRGKRKKKTSPKRYVSAPWTRRPAGNWSVAW